LNTWSLSVSIESLFLDPLHFTPACVTSLQFLCPSPMCLSFLLPTQISPPTLYCDEQHAISSTVPPLFLCLSKLCQRVFPFFPLSSSFKPPLVCIAISFPKGFFQPGFFPVITLCLAIPFFIEVRSFPSCLPFCALPSGNSISDKSETIQYCFRSDALCVRLDPRFPLLRALSSGPSSTFLRGYSPSIPILFLLITL